VSPQAPLRPCAAPRCPTLVVRGRCIEHARKGWEKPQETPRIRGRALQRMREELFTSEPLCRICRQQGRTTLATIRDHIIPLAEGGADEAANCQPICLSCSDAKTREEAKRGAARARRCG
jgi:5-methylcytosine-specific restriction protein A